MRIYWIRSLNKVGKLGMMARPKGNDWLADEIESLKKIGVSKVVSHLETSEEYELEISKESELCSKYGIDFISYPIVDRNVPANKETFIELITYINNELEKGEQIIIHCRMGIGRTGLTAASVLVKNGFDVESAFDILSEIRNLKMPDTIEQIEFVRKIKNALQYVG